MLARRSSEKVVHVASRRALPSAAGCDGSTPLAMYEMNASQLPPPPPMSAYASASIAYAGWRLLSAVAMLVEDFGQGLYAW